MAMFNICVVVQFGFKTFWERCGIRGNKDGIVSKDLKRYQTQKPNLTIIAKEIWRLDFTLILPG